MRTKHAIAMLLALALLVNSALFIQPALAVANQAPIAQSDAYSVQEGDTLVVPEATGILKNDYDPDNDELVIELQGVEYNDTYYPELRVTGEMTVRPAGGSLTIRPDGSFSYTPDQGVSQGVFSYRLWDGTTYSGLPQDEESSATWAAVVITVNPRTTAILTISVVGNGEIYNLAPSQEVALGTVVEVTASPRFGYKLDKWVVNGADVDASPILNVTMDADKHVEAIFVLGFTMTKTANVTTAKNGDTIKYTITVDNTSPTEGGHYGVSLQIEDDLLWPSDSKCIEVGAGETITIEGEAEGCWYLVPAGTTPRVISNTATARLLVEGVTSEVVASATATVAIEAQEVTSIVIRPIFEGWKNNGDGTYTAYFGYQNESTIDRGNGPEPYTVNVPTGPSNKLTPATHNGLLPTTFGYPNVVPGRPGRTSFYPGPGFAFVIDNWDGSNIVWSLLGRTCTASLVPHLEKKDTYTLVTSVKDDVGGWVWVDPEKERYDKGEEVDIYAEPHYLYMLKHWLVNGALVTAVNPLELTMDENKVVEAVFEPMLSITKAADKAEARNGDTIKYTITVTNNAPVFNGEMGASNGYYSAYDIYVFDEMLWPGEPKVIEYLAAGQTFTFAGQEDGCWYVVPQGTTPRTITNTAIARVPYMQATTMEADGPEYPEHFEVSASASVNIVAPPSPPPYYPPVQINYVVKATAEAGGTATGGGSFLPGQYANLLATPAEGYTFVSWTEGGNVVGTEPTLRFQVLSGRTLVANFAPIPVQEEIVEVPVEEPPIAPAPEPVVEPVLDEPTPQAPAVLPQTGELPAVMLYGLGTALAALGLLSRKRK